MFGVEAQIGIGIKDAKQFHHGLAPDFGDTELNVFMLWL